MDWKEAIALCIEFDHQFEGSQMAECLWDYFISLVGLVLGLVWLAVTIVLLYHNGLNESVTLVNIIFAIG